MEEYRDRSLSGRVFQKIRDDILGGRYNENDELREIAIGKEMSVSRTPVREAFRQLEQQGLVTIIPNKGTYVTGITQKDVQDIYVIRTLLEGLCARWATEHITQEQTDRLEEIILLSEFHVKKEDAAGAEYVASLDGEFHAVLYDACNSKMLCRTLKDYHRYVEGARMQSVISTDRARKSIREHKLILRAIKDKDQDLAEQLAGEHVMHAMQNLNINE